MALTFSAPVTFQGNQLNPGTEFLVTVGSSQYYITQAEVGNGDGGIVVWQWNGSSWSQLADNTTIASGFVADSVYCLAAVASGNTIYIVGVNGSNNLSMMRFSTSSNTFLTNVAGPATAAGVGRVGAAVFPSGNIIVSYPGTGGTLRAVVFNTGSATWGSSAQAVATATVLPHIGMWAGGPLAFLFYSVFNGGTTHEVLWCISSSEALSFGTAQTAVDLDFSGVGGSANHNWAFGMPAVTNDPASPHLAIPYCDPAGSSASVAFGVLKVARAVCGSNPSFSLETVDSSPPAGIIFGVLFNGSSRTPFIGAAADQSDGSLYLFAAATPGTLAGGDDESGASHYYLYQYVSSGPGTWSARTQTYDSGTASGDGIEGFSPIPAVDGNGKIAVLFTQVDIAGWFGATPETSITHVYLTQGAPPNYHFRVLTSANLAPASSNDLDWTVGGVQL
jgi:hypothetical protein